MKITIETGEHKTVSKERASWNIKWWFCMIGTFCVLTATFNMFGPWFAKVVGVLGYAAAVLCFHTAYKEHKKPFYED